MVRSLPKLWAVACAAILSASASAQLETRITFPALPGPQSVAVGDFNGDGKLDLAVVSLDTTGQVSVLLGNGDGTFQPAVNYDVGSGPYYVAVADLRHIGKLDLVVANSASDSISVLLGNGDGTFQPAANYPTPPEPRSVAVGDFNGDHVLDLVALEVTGTCHCISVLLGNGDGSFQEPPITTTPSFPPSAVAVGDFNDDGKLDVATGGFSFTSGEVNILLGNGDGTFRQGATYVVNGAPVPVIASDLREVGRLDLVFGGGGGVPGSVGVLLGNGDGTFGAATYYAAGYPDWLAVGDLNGDGKPDLVASDINTIVSTPGSIATLLGNGDGTFQPPRMYPAGKEPFFPAVGDFNGDGQQDLVVLDALESDVTIFLNTGPVTFSPTTPLAFSPQLIGTTSAAQGVTLTNSGVTSLSIASISVRSAPSSAGGTAPASQPFSLTSNCGKSVPAGGSCNVNVRFRPQVIGAQNALVSIVDSASSKPQVIELSGQGTVVKLLPAQLNFPPQKAGTTSHPMTVQLTNTSSKALHINSITRGGVDPFSFKEQNTCGSQVAAGASCTISVVFAPNQPGSFQAVVNISDNGGGTQFVPLSGTGT